MKEGKDMLKNLYTSQDKLNYKQIPLLNYLTEDEFYKMESNFEVLQFKRNEHIFNSGDPASKMFILYSGFMKITKILSDGREQMMYLYQPGDFVGGLNLLSGDTYVYNGVALRDCVVITISKQDFHEVLMKNTDFMRSVLVKSYERIRRAEALVDRLSVINADLKVAKALINLIKVYGQQTDKGILLKLTLNQEELGSYAGVTRETMSRKLRQFEEAGLIKILGRSRILLVDVKGLSDLTI